MYREKQYYRQLNEVWGIKKNLTVQELDHIENTLEKREKEGKETRVKRYGVPLSNENLKRRKARRFVPTFESKRKAATQSSIEIETLDMDFDIGTPTTVAETPKSPPETPKPFPETVGDKTPQRALSLLHFVPEVIPSLMFQPMHNIDSRFQDIDLTRDPTFPLRSRESSDPSITFPPSPSTNNNLRLSQKPIINMEDYLLGNVSSKSQGSQYTLRNVLYTVEIEYTEILRAFRILEKLRFELVINLKLNSKQFTQFLVDWSPSILPKERSPIIYEAASKITTPQLPEFRAHVVEGDLLQSRRSDEAATIDPPEVREFSDVIHTNAASTDHCIFYHYLNRKTLMDPERRHINDILYVQIQNLEYLPEKLYPIFARLAIRNNFYGYVLAIIRKMKVLDYTVMLEATYHAAAPEFLLDVDSIFQLVNTRIFDIVYIAYIQNGVPEDEAESLALVAITLDFKKGEKSFLPFISERCKSKMRHMSKVLSIHELL
ncbi:hypothetical protein ABW20_dc0104670 [Dactylellina cionopaga]|nr:hypothetical protein ABW20_dc0104670 [Dactylellina cionopaga]